MVTIILAHPWHGSFNKVILDTVVKKFDNENKPYQVIDLNKDNFNPVLTEAELSLYSKGKYSDPLVGKYQDMIRITDEVIFIFPIWWGTMPAILKGLFDKVFLTDFSHNYMNGWTPLLNIKKTTVLTTSESPTDFFRSSIESDFINQMLLSVGFQNVTWINCDRVVGGGDAHRAEFLTKVEAHI